MTSERLTVALVGLGFGAEFLPIYLHHPDVEQLVVFDPAPEVAASTRQRFGLSTQVTHFEDILENPSIDAVHLVSPIPEHAAQALAVLESGKHCACTVPMATTLDDLKAIVAAQRRTGKYYMSMETAVYTREFLYAKSLLEGGQLGRIQFLRGAHYQDMEGWPDYWQGLPPMYYASHALAPLLALSQGRTINVHAFGSGTMRDELKTRYGNPYPVETAIFQIETPDRGTLAAEVTRTLFETARPYSESFSVYGDAKGYEWQQLEHEDPLVFTLGQLGRGRGRSLTAERVTVPDRQDLLPSEISRFTRRGVYDETNPHLSFLQGGGHSGSHPHLVHEFVRSIVEKRSPWPDAVTAANWTAAGICAHQSAIQGGQGVEVPRFDVEVVSERVQGGV